MAHACLRTPGNAHTHTSALKGMGRHTNARRTKGDIHRRGKEWPDECLLFFCQKGEPFICGVLDF